MIKYSTILHKYAGVVTTGRYNQTNFNCYIVKNINCPHEILKKIYKDYKENENEYFTDLTKDIVDHPNWKLSDFE